MITEVKAYEVDGVIRRNVITPIQELIPNNRVVSSSHKTTQI